MNATTYQDRVDSIAASLIGYAHDEYGNDLHALLEDGHAARGVIEDACYWRGWPHTQDLLADTLAAARTRADELAEEAAWDATNA